METNQPNHGESNIHSFFFGALTREMNKAAGDLDPFQHPMAGYGLCVAGLFIPSDSHYSPSGAYFAGCLSESVYSVEEVAEFQAQMERDELLDQGLYDEFTPQPDGWTAEDRRLELIEAAGAAESDSWL